MEENNKTKRVKTFWRRYNEFLVLPLAVALLIISPKFFRWIDPTSASFDLGILQVIFLGLIKVLSASACAWLLLKFSFPSLYRLLDDYHEQLLTAGRTEIKDWDYNKELCLKHALYLYLFYFSMLVISMLLI